MPEQGKKVRLFKPSVYEEKLKAARAKGREQVAKRIQLTKSRDRVANIIKLLTRKAQLKKNGKTDQLKAFNAKYGAYLGNFGDMKKAKGLLSRINTRRNIVLRSIENLRTQVKTANQRLNLSKKREAERRTKKGK